MLVKKPGKDGFWEVVDMLMKHLYKRYPQEMKALELEVSYEHDYASKHFNQYAAAKDKSLRKLGVIPDIVYLALRRVYGVEDNEWPVPHRRFEIGFIRRYPKFRVAPVI